METIKLGSLFDGIGAFPYAASLLGVETLWASEILPHAVSVTRRHFPDMQHVGDITKLDGARLTPVDIIAFGSPCQDLSQAAGGNRKGLAGERSGLFREAIRVINEMRCATNGHYPRYACFENVPGCMSSNSRLDFKAVLEAFTESEVPMPRSGRWANAGLVRSERANIAWCIYDAQHFGLAQRRKRLFLIADFGKGCPESVLLIPKSLPGHFAQSLAERQGATAAPENCAAGAKCRTYGICSFSSNSMKSDNPNSGVYEADTARTLDNNCGNPSCNQGGMAVVAFNGGASPQAGSIALSDTVSPTLKSASSGLRTPCVAVLNDQGGESMNVEKGDCAPTLRCSTHGNLPIVCTAYGFDLQQITSKTNRATLKEVQPSLCSNGRPHVVHSEELPSITLRMRSGCEGGGKGALLQTEKSGTLATGNDQYLFTRQRSDMYRESEAASTQTARQCKEATDLCVYCLQGNMIGRSDENGPRGSGVQADLSYTLTETDVPAVAAVDCRNLKECGDISGTLQAKKTAGYSLNYQNPIRMGYIVRRLTPTECERLMGFDDGWTQYGVPTKSETSWGEDEQRSGTDAHRKVDGVERSLRGRHDGKEISDSRRYSMLGNSIATPCAAYILQGILEQYAKEAIT